jgi:hypothetical protein
VGHNFGAKKNSRSSLTGKKHEHRVRAFHRLKRFIRDFLELLGAWEKSSTLAIGTPLNERKL